MEQSTNSSSYELTQNLLDLPDDVLIEIAKNLNPSDFLTMRATCSSLRNFCTKIQRYSCFRILFLQGKIQEVERRCAELVRQPESEQRNECLRKSDIKLRLYCKDLYYELRGNDAWDY